jgi:hypothetical protein
MVGATTTTFSGLTFSMGFLISTSTTGASASKGTFSLPAAWNCSFLAGDSPILRPSMAEAAFKKVTLANWDDAVVT